MKLPRSAAKSAEIERYLSRSFEYWGGPERKNVSEAMRETKRAVRDCFDRFTAERV
jgi:hypothetical protein